MGRLGLMMVVAVAVSFGIIGVNIRDSNARLTEAQTGFFKYNFARSMAALGIHYYLHCQDTTLYTTAPGYPETFDFNGGSFRYDPFPVPTNCDTTDIVCIGTYAESSYTMKARFVKVPDSIPVAITAGLSICASPTTVSLTGNSAVDGRDHDINGADKPGTAGDLAGLAFSNASDTSRVTTNGNSQVLGSTKYTVNNTGVSQAWAFADLYRQHIDQTITGASGQTHFGTLSRPNIVFADGSNGTVSFSGQVTGYGILLIAGDVKFSGGVTWTGLVVCVDTSNAVTFSETGGSQIIGGVMVASKGSNGATLELKGGGNSGGHILYSSEALAMATAVTVLSHYSIVDWFE